MIRRNTPWQMAASWARSIRRTLAPLLAIALAATLALGVMLHPAPARAQTSEPAQVTQARQLYQQGVSAYDAEDYDTAERLLRQSYQLHPHPVTLRNLAAALERLERRADACNELARLIRVHPAAEERANAQRTLDNLSEKVGRLKLDVSVTGADLKVDDKWIGVAPITVWYVEPGEHTVTAMKAGFAQAKSTVNVDANTEQVVKLELKPTDTTMPGGGLGQDPTVNGGTSSGMRPKTIALIAGGALTVVGLGVGIGFGLDYSSAKSDADDLQSKLGKDGCAIDPNSADCRDLRDKRDQQDSSGTIATVGFIGAGVFGAATLATLLFWPDDKKGTARGERRLLIAPTFGNANGVSLVGTF